MEYAIRNSGKLLITQRIHWSANMPLAIEERISDKNNMDKYGQGLVTCMGFPATALAEV